MGLISSVGIVEVTFRGGGKEDYFWELPLPGVTCLGNPFFPRIPCSAAQINHQPLGGN